VLPRTILTRLRENPTASIIDQVENASVLFVYFDGLNKFDAEADAVSTIKELNLFLHTLDRLCVSYKVEKIKTNPFLVVAGCPEPRTDHAEVLLKLSKDFYREIVKYRKKQLMQYRLAKSAGHAVTDLPRGALRMKVGIHSGRVCAGVLGTTKWIYDVFGDTVNLASRLTSSCDWGNIQVSEATYKLTRHLAHFESRGNVELKGKGLVPVYVLKADRSDENLVQSPLSDKNQFESVKK